MSIKERLLSKNFFTFFFLTFIFGCTRSSLLYKEGGFFAPFSLRWLLWLQNVGSRRAGFSSCSTRTLECRGR